MKPTLVNLPNSFPDLTEGCPSPARQYRRGVRHSSDSESSPAATIHSPLTPQSALHYRCLRLNNSISPAAAFRMRIPLIRTRNISPSGIRNPEKRPARRVAVSYSPFYETKNICDYHETIFIRSRSGGHAANRQSAEITFPRQLPRGNLTSMTSTDGQPSDS